MGKRLQFRNVFMLGFLVLAAYGLLAYRLVDLQVLRHEQLRVRALQNTERKMLMEPVRGNILDAKGNLLATSTILKTICADPSLVGTNQAEVARVLSPLLEVPEAKLVQSLTPRFRKAENGEPSTNRISSKVCLKRRVSDETWIKVKDAMAKLKVGGDEKTLKRNEVSFLRDLRQKAVFAQNEQVRSYPSQSLAVHVVGFTSSEEQTMNHMFYDEIKGVDGIEKTFNESLSGGQGLRVTETDSKGSELVPMRAKEVEANDGLNVVLTIDSVIQQFAESALTEAMEKYSPISASAIVIRPRSGEILAMATLPNFDPNNLRTSTAEQRRNRVISDIAEPGSVFKIVVVSGALNDGIVRLTDQFDCEHGHFRFAGVSLGDHIAYGDLSVENIITKSSNIGAAKIGIKMGEKRLYDYIQRFGFGEGTGIPLPNEVSALRWVPPPKKWSKVSIAQIPMGQGISVTRLQMTMAMCAIANGGKLMRPMLVNHLEDADHHVVAQFQPVEVRRVVSEATSKLMVQALKTVVTTNGTAPKAALDHYTVAGKTGTAQKVENGHYVHDKFFSSFIGFFPADNPELCVSVTLDEPDRRKAYYGGQTAAPVFKQIAEKAASYLNIRPEDVGPASVPDAVLAPDATISKQGQ